MRANAWIGAVRRAALGLSLLAGLVTLGSVGDALAQGMSNPMGGPGYRSEKADPGYRGDAARPGPSAKGYAFGPGPALKKGYAYGPPPRGKGYYRPATRPKRANSFLYRSAAPKTCGQFHYWSPEKGRCMDARGSPPALK